MTINTAGTIVGRALFLAASWTWCIGMFLPVLLIDDFGVWGWVAFAVPNVIGAALVGVIHTPGRAASVARDHRGAMRLFSAVTIAFHLYFLGRITPFMGVPHGGIGPAGQSIVLLFIVVAAAWAVSRLRTPGAWMIAAGVTIGLSVLAMLLIERTSGGPALAAPPATGKFPVVDAVWATPALFFGFMLCPHLDLTLLRVRRETPGGAGVAAFAIGFGVIFLALITLTMLYAHAFLPGGRLSYWIGLHFFAQGVFTVAAHWRELREKQPGGDDDRRVVFGLIALGALLGVAWPVGEFRLGYDLILFAYAVPLPAYVWFVMIPRTPGRRREIAAWLTAVLIAAPIFAVGFLAPVWPLVAVAVGVMLAAPVVERSLGRRVG